MTKKIPKSSWTLKCEYFKVKLIDDFKEQMIQYIMGLDGYSQQELHQEGLYTVIDEWQLKSDNGTLELYQYPLEPDSQIVSAKIIEYDSDYFEREDDNWVIPRHLFIVV